MTILIQDKRGLNPPILMYHEVLDVHEENEKTQSTNPIYRLSAEQFREQMQCLSDNGFQSLSLNELINHRRKEYQKSVVITFDDGWENNYLNAFPVLKKFGLTATIFILTDFIGKDRYMNWSQLQEMVEAGISIQSHTASHRPLSILNAREIKYELEYSKKTIEDGLGTQVEFLSVPHGMINTKVIHIAKSAGYKAICTSEPGFNHRFGEPAVLKRINISDSYSLSKFKKIINADPKALYPEIISKKIKNSIKKVLGFDTYRKLYRLAYRIKQ